MADLINLRRARKAKGRAEKEREAEANRVRHGVAKSVRSLAQATSKKTAQELDRRKLEDKDEA
jgi:hypothetical protein